MQENISTKANFHPQTISGDWFIPGGRSCGQPTQWEWSHHESLWESTVNQWMNCAEAQSSWEWLVENSEDRWHIQPLCDTLMLMCGLLLCSGLWSRTERPSVCPVPVWLMLLKASQSCYTQKTSHWSFCKLAGRLKLKLALGICQRVLREPHPHMLQNFVMMHYG